MLRVEDYIDSLNKKLRNQVTISVTVYSLKLNNNSEWNYSLSSLFSALKGRFSGTLGVDSLTSGNNQAMSGVMNSNTKFLLDILDSQGKVSVADSATVTTMSGQPVPLQVANARGYVSQITTTVSDNVTSTSATTSAVNTGFSLDILPKVLNDGKVLVQYGVNISSLVGAQNGFDNVKIGENNIQLPNINQHAFIQESLMKNDETLVLAGYQKSDTESGDSGKGNPNFKILGGSRDAIMNKQLIIICLTPTIINLDADNDG
ncbi:Outer membrane lipoprotein BfpB [Sodalis praecaptivus]